MLTIVKVRMLGFDRQFPIDHCLIHNTHTRIASYRHLGARSVGGRVRLLALDSRNAGQAGGLSSLRQTHCKSCVPKRLFIAFIMPGHFKRLL